MQTEKCNGSGSMYIFYTPGLISDTVVLSGEESGHAVRVLRLKEHDPVVVVDGKGKWCEAELVHAHAAGCMVKINGIKDKYGKRNYRLCLAVAPTKQADRMEWLIEKATEIGVDEFYPLLCRHSERKNLNAERMEKIAVAAMKQSMQAYLPRVHPVTRFQEILDLPFPGVKFIAHCFEGAKPHLKELLKGDKETMILIGPEGDFSREEVEMAKQSGFKEVSLGNFRMRTETAALAACHTVALNHINQELENKKCF